MKRRRTQQRKLGIGDQRPNLEYYLNLKYPVLLVPEPEGGFTALIPDLPGCVSVGETQEEALKNVEEARQLWLETAYEYGDEIPLPSPEREYSGRILLRMPKSLHRRLAEEAEAEGVSLNQYILSLLSERSALKAVSGRLLQHLASMLQLHADAPIKVSATTSWDSSSNLSLSRPTRAGSHENLPVA